MMGFRACAIGSQSHCIPNLPSSCPRHILVQLAIDAFTNAIENLTIDLMCSRLFPLESQTHCQSQATASHIDVRLARVIQPSHLRNFTLMRSHSAPCSIPDSLIIHTFCILFETFADVSHRLRLVDGCLHGAQAPISPLSGRGRSLLSPCLTSIQRP